MWFAHRNRICKEIGGRPNPPLLFLSSLPSSSFAFILSPLPSLSLSPSPLLPFVHFFLSAEGQSFKTRIPRAMKGYEEMRKFMTDQVEIIQLRAQVIRMHEKVKRKRGRGGERGREREREREIDGG